MYKTSKYLPLHYLKNHVTNLYSFERNSANIFIKT